MLLQMNFTPACEANCGAACGAARPGEQPRTAPKKRRGCPSFVFLDFTLNQLGAGIYSETEPNCPGKSKDFIPTGLLWENGRGQGQLHKSHSRLP